MLAPPISMWRQGWKVHCTTAQQMSYFTNPTQPFLIEHEQRWQSLTRLFYLRKALSLGTNQAVQWNISCCSCFRSLISQINPHKWVFLACSKPSCPFSFKPEPQQEEGTHSLQKSVELLHQLHIAAGTTSKSSV